MTDADVKDAEARRLEADGRRETNWKRWGPYVAEYAKAAPDDVLIRLSVANRGPDSAALHLPPTLWFRNVWAWGREGDRYPAKPRLHAAGGERVVAEHDTLGTFVLDVGAGPSAEAPELLFTENDTNVARLFGGTNASPHVKDAFHARVIARDVAAVNPERDRVFLARVFHKLPLNFAWWVNRKDLEGHNLFAGGFLGLDNIGVFDRSYEDVASKFFEHFVAITDAMNTLGGAGLWDDADGFYYDQLHLVLFHEYFHGDSGRGLGASHQTGWTALVVRCLENLAAGRRVPTAHDHAHEHAHDVAIAGTWARLP